MKIYSFLFLIFVLSSCSYLTKKIELMNELPNEKKSVGYKKLNYCPIKSKLQYISKDEYSLKFYKNLHPNLFEIRVYLL